MKDPNIRELTGSAAWGFRALELPEQLALAARLGMRFHELGIANADTDIPLDASVEALERVRALYREKGISLTCAATGNDFTGEDADTQVEKVKCVISMCKTLGVAKLRIFAGFTPLTDMTEEKWEKLLQCMRYVAREAERRGVVLCVETHGAVEPLHDGVRHIRSATTQIEDLLKIVEAANIQIVFDPANLYAVGVTDLMEFWEAVKHRVGYIHLKDFRAGQQGQLYPCALGEGGTPWEPLREAMAGSNVPVLFEYENCEDLEQGIQACVTCWKGETIQ